MTNKGKLIEKVYATDLSQRATLVIFYLINRADQENTCFPSVKTIAKECNISTRTVQRALNDLEVAGILMRESRFHTRGGQRSNLYRLIIIDDNQEQNLEVTKPDKSIENQDGNNISIFSENSNLEYVTHPAEKDYKTHMSSDFEQVDFTSYSVIGTLERQLSGVLCHDGIP